MIMIQTRVTCWHRITRTFVPRQSGILYVNASVETVVSDRIVRVVFKAHFHTILYQVLQLNVIL